MAGGTASDIRAPYPKGDAGLVCITFGPVEVIASKGTANAADYVFDQFTVPFSFKPVRAEYTAEDITIGNANLVVNIEDDTGTAKVIVDDAALTAITAGAGVGAALTIANRELVINAGAVLIASYSSKAGDTTTALKLRLWVKPVN